MPALAPLQHLKLPAGLTVARTRPLLESQSSVVHCQVSEHVQVCLGPVKIKSRVVCRSHLLGSGSLPPPIARFSQNKSLWIRTNEIFKKTGSYKSCWLSVNQFITWVYPCHIRSLFCMNLMKYPTRARVNCMGPRVQLHELNTGLRISRNGGMSIDNSCDLWHEIGLINRLEHEDACRSPVRHSRLSYRIHGPSALIVAYLVPHIINDDKIWHNQDELLSCPRTCCDIIAHACPFRNGHLL